jgi:hypothetical protein
VGDVLELIAVVIPQGIDTFGVALARESSERFAGAALIALGAILLTVRLTS